MQRRFLLFAASTAIFVPALLLIDSPGLLPQLALGAATLAFLFLATRTAPIETRQIVFAILIATTGEIVLSLGWGLYSYRNAVIPLYVPFGHGLFYALAAETARQHALQRYSRAITRAVLVAGSVVAAAGLLLWNDQWGLLWWIAAAALLARSRNPLLLSACFVYTMLLEWIGTAIGNWEWASVVPGLGLHSANPPSGVGILYIVLDVLTVAVASAASRPRPAGTVCAGDFIHVVEQEAGTLH